MNQWIIEIYLQLLMSTILLYFITMVDVMLHFLF